MNIQRLFANRWALRWCSNGFSYIVLRISLANVFWYPLFYYRAFFASFIFFFCIFINFHVTVGISDIKDRKCMVLSFS